MKLTKEILREAARKIAEGEETFSCCAICVAANTKANSTVGDELRAEYGESLGLNRFPRMYDFDAFGKCDDEVRNHRVIALLMCAESL